MRTLELSLLGAWVVCFAVGCSSSDNGGTKPAGTSGSANGAAGANAAAGASANGAAGANAAAGAGASAGAATVGGGGATTGSGAAGAATAGSSSAQGGTDSSAAGAAGAAVVTRPALVTSGPGAYWQVGTLTPMSGGTATVTVDPASKLQNWIGFGGTFNEAGWDALSVLTQADRDPGAVRVKTTGGSAVSFKNPDGSLVTVLFNSTASAATTTVALGGGTTVQAQVPAQGWATIYWKG